MNDLRNFSPEKFVENEELGRQRLDLSIGQENVGYAEVVYIGSPFPFYYLADLYVEKEHQKQKKGFGKALLKRINEYLDQTNKAGILLNSIGIEDSDPHPAQDMFRDNGWTEVIEEPDWYTYNIPEIVTREQILQAINSIREKSYFEDHN